MSTIPKCPECGGENTYDDGSLYVCPDCSHEWPYVSDETKSEEKFIVKDAFGNILQDGDSVTVIKDLKVKGASGSVKVGTKVRNIRLVEEGDHNIDCKIEGFGSMQLKSEFVKKA